jgi:hypothetical protein
VTATNAYGTSPASAVSNSVTPVAQASIYTFTGPAGGALNAASSSFTVTPNSLYTGTITITPSGGGLSAPIILAFSNSAAAQTFTVTPTAVGPVTLTAANSGSLSNPAALTYATPSDAPAIGTVTAGNGSASIAFMAPGNDGGSMVSGYTVNCSGYPATGTSSPITVSGLNSGSVYTCSVTATNGAGTSAASAASNAVTPVEPANSYALTGPSGGAVGFVSSDFTVTPNSVYTGTITITPSGGGLSAPITLTFGNSASPQTFTVTPTAVGPVSLTATNSGSLSNPTALTYATPSDAPVIGSATAGNGSATIAFIAPGNDGGSIVSGYTVDCGGGQTASGTSSPITVAGLTNGSIYTCSVTASNGAGTSAPSAASNAVTPLEPANSYALTGPSGGAIGSVSGAFTVTPNSVYTGSITITPSGGGLSTPVVLTFSSSAAAQTFTVTPTAVGPVTLTAANSGSLSNPTALTYATPSDAPAIGTATAGNGSATIAFTAPSNDGGSIISGYTVDCGGGHTASGTSSPIEVSGLMNGSVYTCRVTASNGAGTSAPSAASSAVTPVEPANSYALTGPSGGAIGSSSVFTVTPNLVYSGTITITPLGGGLSAPITLTFSSSAAPQTFTITPRAVGPVTLTPANSGSLSNPTALIYATPSDAPVIGTATAGNGSASIAFTAPGNDGGSIVTGYTVDCGGGHTATGTSSLITVSGLTNGSVYTCTVRASNGVGASAPSAASNAVTPLAPASSYTFTGPAGGALNVASSSFTVKPNSVYTGAITITPSGGGLSAPITVTFTNSAAAQTFTVTPTAVGPVSLTPTNSGGLSNPSALTYATPPAAPAIGTATAGNGSASIGFTAPGATGGSAITTYRATCNPSAETGTGSSSPITVLGLTYGTAYSCSVTATNAYGTSPASAASSVTPMAPASSYTFAGPAGGSLNAASSSFTVTPDSPYTGAITITPAGGGLSAPITLTFGNSAAAQTFTVTPTAVGPVILTAGNSGSLSNPAALTYATPSDAPVIGTATAGNGSASIAFTAPGNDGGSVVSGYTVDCSGYPGTGTSSPIIVSGLTNGSAYICTVTATNSAGTSAPSAASNAVTPVEPANSYALTGPSGGSVGSVSSAFTVTPNALYTGTISITPSGAGLSAPITLTFSNSAAAQMFTMTPTAVGPVTLTATNSGSLANPTALTYATPSDAPVIGTATAGNGSATIAFTVPGNDGGSIVSGYTVDCGGYPASGTSSPITVSGLNSGSVYTCSVTATNGAGTSAASAASSAVTPLEPSNSFALTGPSGGAIGYVSGAFTVTPNSVYTGSITITPSGGGLSAPIILAFSNSAAAQTFTVTPTAVGPVSLTAINSGSLANPAALTYATPPDAPVIGTATAGNGSASIAFTAAGIDGGSIVSGYTVDCGGGHTASGSSSPIEVSGLINGSVYTCGVTATNGAGASAPSAPSNAVTPIAPANSYALTGPSGGAIGSVSNAFTVTPNSLYTGSITITPNGGGLSAPITLTFSNSAAAQTFTVTPTAVGPVSLTAINSGSLANPTALTYATPSDAPVIGTATAGNGSATIAFTAPGNNGGSIVSGYTVECGDRPASGTSSPITVSGLTNGSVYTCSVTATNGAGTSAPSAASNAVTPLAPASSFSLTSTSNTTQTATAGGTATYILALGPTGGITFPAPATLSVSGLPAGATATLTPTVVPAGFPLTNVTLKVQLAASSASLDKKQPPHRGVPPVVWSILLVPFFGKLRRRNKNPRRTFCGLLLLSAVLAASIGLTGCGSNNGFFDQNLPKSYPLTVTATAGPVSHSATVTLIVD